MQIQIHKSHTRMMRNTVILFTAMLLTKLIGAVLKIPLTNILGGLGMGYFSTANSLFSPVYAITAAGIPTVIMRLTAQNAASGHFRNVRAIRRAGLIASFGLGIVGSVGIFIIAKPFAAYVAGSPDSFPAMLAVAPSLLFCGMAAVYRGYHEGLSNMLPTAISQIIEALIKSALGITLAITFASHGVAYAAAAAIAGITVAEFFGLAFLLLRTHYFSDGITSEQLCKSPVPQRKRVIIKSVLSESLPVTLAAVATNLNPFIDMMTIPNMINATVIGNRAYFLANYTYGAYGGESISDIGNFIYGSYTGIAIPIFAVATTVTAMVSKSALPEIAACACEPTDRRSLNHSLQMLFKGAFITGLPICIGLAALAEPILSMLYFSRPAEVAISAPPLAALGLGGVSLILAGTLFSVFMALGRTDLQVKLMLLGATIKFTGNLILIRIPQLNVMGAAISTVISYTIISFIGVILLKRIIPKSDMGIFSHITKPLLSALLCGGTAYLCYNHILPRYFDNKIPLLATSIILGGLVYFVAIALFHRRELLLRASKP